MWQWLQWRSHGAMTVPLVALLWGLAADAGAQPATGPGRLEVFGVIDLSLRHVDNGSAPARRSLSSDGLSSSRFGLRGSEDLGSGLEARFWLESLLAADTGSTIASRFWARRATVSIAHARWGELRLGRDNVPLFIAYAIYSPFGASGLGQLISPLPMTAMLSGLGSGTSTFGRADNQVSYLLPPGLGGLYGQVAIAPSEGHAGGRFHSARVGHAAGRLDISAGYAETEVALGDRFRQRLVGGSFDFGTIKLGGQIVLARYDSAAGGPRRQRVLQFGISVPIGSGVLRADVIHGDMSGGARGSGFGDADDARQWSLGYAHALSRRTALYVSTSSLRNAGASRLVVAAGNAGLRDGETSTGYDLGLRHAF